MKLFDEIYINCHPIKYHRRYKHDYATQMSKTTLIGFHFILMFWWWLTLRTYYYPKALRELERKYYESRVR